MRSSVTDCNVTAGHGVSGVKLWFAQTATKTRFGAGRPAVAQDWPQLIALPSSHWQVTPGQLVAEVQEEG